MDKTEFQKAFELFCEKYNLSYSFNSRGDSYMIYETQKAYIIFKYSESFKYDGSNQEF